MGGIIPKNNSNQDPFSFNVSTIYSSPKFRRLTFHINFYSAFNVKGCAYSTWYSNCRFIESMSCASMVVVWHSFMLVALQLYSCFLLTLVTLELPISIDSCRLLASLTLMKNIMISFTNFFINVHHLWLYVFTHRHIGYTCIFFFL